MAATADTHSETLLRAKTFYDAELRAKLEPEQNGKYIVIDGESLDYEVDENMMVASVHLEDRRPNGQTLVIRIGYETALRLPLMQPDSYRRAVAEQSVPLHKTEKTFLPLDNRSPASLRAEAFYDAELRAKLEPAHKGKYILIDPASRDYEVDSDPIAAAVHLRDRHPNGEWIIFRIGYDIHQCVFHGLRFHL